MAIVRCDTCGKPTTLRVTPPGYADQPYFPVGHPNSGVVCGTVGCENPGLVWLKKDEQQEYVAGTRVFSMVTRTTKVRVQ
jgi:hypothetical protein